jgi:dTDP-glucose 4,6-dehydratase
MKYKAKKMLVTGGTGFIGCNFVRYMLAKYKDIKIINLDKLTYAGNKDNLPNDPRHIFIKGDICDANLVNELMQQYDIDTIVHFAAESHVDRSIDNSAPFIETNIVGTYTLLEAARKSLRRFHHISTDEVYGELGPNDPPFNEITPYNPSSPYSASKASSDHLVRAYFRTYNLPITISNCSNNYGPYPHAAKLIPRVIRCCIEQQPIPVYGDGSNIRDWLYVEDHCRAIDTIITKGKIGETYNIGGNCEISNISLVTKICEIMQQKRPTNGKYSDLITFVKDRPGHDWRYGIDNSKIKNMLKWQPQYNFANGLRATMAHYKVF